MESEKVKIIAALFVGVLMIAVSCIFSAATRNSLGSATYIIPFEELTEEEQSALIESLELDLYETEKPANLTKLVHPGKESFVEYRISIETTGRIPFFARNEYIEKTFKQYSPTEQLIYSVRRGYYFREDKIYICAVQSNKLPFAKTAAEIFNSRNADGQHTAEAETEAAA